METKGRKGALAGGGRLKSVTNKSRQDETTQSLKQVGPESETGKERNWSLLPWPAWESADNKSESHMILLCSVMVEDLWCKKCNVMITISLRLWVVRQRMCQGAVRFGSYPRTMH